MPPPSVLFQKTESTYSLLSPLSSTPFQLPVNVQRRTIALRAREHRERAGAVFAWYSPPVSMPT
jgi:hypothetical protein